MAVRRLLDSSKLFRLVKYLVVIGLVFMLVPYINTPNVHDAYVDVLRSFQDEKKLFLQDFMAHDREAQLPDHGLQVAKLCDNRTWFPEDKAVILTCDPLPGGVGSVKNGQLNCIRFAIEIGSQLVLPRMHPRSESDITNFYGAKNSKGIALDYMFSVDHLVESLATTCPQLKVHRSLDDLYDKPSLLQPLNILDLAHITQNEQPSVLNGTLTTILEDPSLLRPALLAAIEYRKPKPPAKRHWPLRVNLGNSWFVWPTLERGEALRREMGSLLHTRDDIRLLAGSAIYNLARRFDLPQLLRQDSGFTGAGTLANFTGIHLRTEKDAQDFPGADIQMEYFLGYLKNRKERLSSAAAAAAAAAAAVPSLPEDAPDNAVDPLAPPSPVPNQPRQQVKSIVYLATGLRAVDADVQHFRTRAAEYDATVVLKRDLLDGAELAVLDHLTWDQRALVDYEIMLRVGHMIGVVESNFAWNLALKRTALYGGKGGGSDNGHKAFTAQPDSGEGELIMWHDRLSTLYGKSDEAVSRYYGTWP